jgi:hypothetical protein
MSKPVISAVIIEEAGPIKGERLSFAPNLQEKVVEISKEALSRSIAAVVADMNDILATSAMNTEKVELSEVAVAVQVSASGGIQWIASANASIASSMTLTFKIKH